MTSESWQINGACSTRPKHNSVGHVPVQRLYDLKRAAQYLGRSVWGVRELIWAGEFRVIRDGKKQYLDLFDMDQYIKRNRVSII